MDDTFTVDDIHRLRLDLLPGRVKQPVQPRTPPTVGAREIEPTAFKGPRGAKRPLPVKRRCECERPIVDKRTCAKCGHPLKYEYRSDGSGTPWRGRKGERKPRTREPV